MKRRDLIAGTTFGAIRDTGFRGDEAYQHLA
jgi:hypothetical protein